MDNKKKLLIGGGVAAAVILIIVLVLLLGGGKETREDKTTTSSQLGNITTEENTTLKEETSDETTVAEVESSNETTEESSDEETTLAEESSSKEEETTTKTTVDAGKETTSKKEEKTTKQNNTTKKPTTSKQETTTQEQATTKPKPKSGRIKDCELAILEKCIAEYPERADGESIYSDLDGQFNPFVEERDVFKWDNVVVQPFLGSMFEKPDYFANQYPNDIDERQTRRLLYLPRKYIEAIIKECDAWKDNSSKYGMESGFGEYLQSRYSMQGSSSIFNETQDENWCEKWYYYDAYLNEYSKYFIPFHEFKSITYTEDGYFTNVNKVYELVSAKEGDNMDYVYYVYCRWSYDSKADKTTVYVVTGSGAY